MKRLLLIYLKTLAKALLAFAALFGGCLFILGEKNRAPYDWELPALQAQADAQRAANKANAEFQTLIADVYHVEQSRFLQPDLLWVTLPPGTPDIQSETSLAQNRGVLSRLGAALCCLAAAAKQPALGIEV